MARWPLVGRAARERELTLNHRTPSDPNLKRSSDAHSGFGVFDGRDVFDGGAGWGPDLRSGLSSLPARVPLGRGRLLRMRLYLPASMQRVGIGPRRPVR